SDFPPEVRKIATSLKMELAKQEREPMLRGDLAVALLRELNRAYGLAGGDDGFDEIRREWGRLSSTLGKRVALQIGPHRLEGFAQALDEDGSLLVRCDDGRIEHVVSGDVMMEK
ncbi:MAG: biotin--[acetyl-CoA-carboxylase] ligase, partial [Verrucomicrobiia bacterium]